MADHGNPIFKVTAKHLAAPLLALNLEHSDQESATFEVTVRMDTTKLRGPVKDEAWVLMQILEQYLADARRAHANHLTGNCG